MTETIEKNKYILFQLYYNPTVAFKRLKIKEDITEENIAKAKEKLLEELKQNPLFLFAKETPFLSTEDIDLGIKDPLIRDIILEHCHQAVDDGIANEKTIRLFKTEDDSSEMATRRIIGGLKMINFTNQEANYLRETCNLYPIALLIERLLQKTSSPKTNAKATATDNATTVDNSTADNTTTDNKIDENILVLLLAHKPLVTSMFENKKRLEEAGIDIEVLLKNESSIKEFFENATNLLKNM